MSHDNLSWSQNLNYCLRIVYLWRTFCSLCLTIVYLWRAFVVYDDTDTGYATATSFVATATPLIFVNLNNVNFIFDVELLYASSASFSKWLNEFNENGLCAFVWFERVSFRSEQLEKWKDKGVLRIAFSSKSPKIFPLNLKLKGGKRRKI